MEHLDESERKQLAETIVTSYNAEPSRADDDVALPVDLMIPRVRNTLAHENITTFGELTKLSEAEALRIPYLNVQGLKNIKHILSLNGREFAQQNFPSTTVDRGDVTYRMIDAPETIGDGTYEKGCVFTFTSMTAAKQFSQMANNNKETKVPHMIRRLASDETQNSFPVFVADAVLSQVADMCQKLTHLSAGTETQR